MDENVCNSKQKWNKDGCRCECKELDNWDSYKDFYTWNPSTCDCKSNKACKNEENLDTKNFSCKKRLFGKLVLARVDEVLNTTDTSFDDQKEKCEKNNCLIYCVIRFHR